MSVHRQPNASSWSVKWRINGQSKTKSFSDKKFGGKAEAKAQAEAFDTQLKADILRNEYYDPQKNKISLSDFKHEVGLTKAVHKESSKQSLEHTWESRVAPYPIADKSIAITFGRFNPPTIGHGKLLDKMNSVRADVKRVYLSKSEDSDKNPLKFRQKVSLMKRMLSVYEEYKVKSRSYRSRSGLLSS